MQLRRRAGWADDRHRRRSHAVRLPASATLASCLLLLPTTVPPDPWVRAAATTAGVARADGAIEPPGVGPAARRPSLASWPLQPAPAVLRPFDAPAQRWSPGHRGVDLAASAGQAVLAPAAGTVTFAGVVVDRGVLTLTHAGGLRSSFEPVTAQTPVGTVVAQGQAIAVVDPRVVHCAPVTCLHWGVRRGEVYLDPLRLVVPPPPSVLLPLAGTSGAPPAGGRGRGAPADGSVPLSDQGLSGPVWAGPVRAGPVRAGPVRAGPVRAGPVRAGPVRVGQAVAR